MSFSKVDRETGDLTTVAGTPSFANQVGYDNTSSGLSASNVQSAIDEVAVETWKGTSQEWNELSTAEKIKHKYAVFTDDEEVVPPVIPVEDIELSELNPTYVTNSLKCHRWGNVVNLHGFFTTKGAITTSLTNLFGNLPRPANGDIDFLGGDYGNQGGVFNLIIRGSYGVLQNRGNLATDKTILVNCTYICKEGE